MARGSRCAARRAHCTASGARAATGHRVPSREIAAGRAGRLQRDPRAACPRRSRRPRHPSRRCASPGRRCAAAPPPCAAITIRTGSVRFVARHAATGAAAKVGVSARKSSRRRTLRPLSVAAHAARTPRLVIATARRRLGHPPRCRLADSIPRTLSHGTFSDPMATPNHAPRRGCATRPPGRRSPRRALVRAARRRAVRAPPRFPRGRDRCLRPRWS